MVFAFWKQNFDFHWGRIVKHIEIIKKNIGFINKIARDTPGHGFDGGSDDVLPRRTLATDGCVGWFRVLINWPRDERNETISRLD